MARQPWDRSFEEKLFDAVGFLAFSPIILPLFIGFLWLEYRDQKRITPKETDHA